MSNVASRRYRAVIRAGLVAALLGASSASAQTASRDCTLRQEAGGLIRGDQVPSGCVLRVEGDELKAYKARRDRGGVLLPVGVPIFFTPRPTLIILSGGILLEVPATDSRAGEQRFDTRRFRARGFGPLFRHFGPLFRNFGRTRPLTRPTSSTGL